MAADDLQQSAVPGASAAAGVPTAATEAPAATAATAPAKDARRPPAAAGPPGDLPPFAGRPVWLTAAGVAALLLAMSGRYGYHRDELYFLAAGHRLAWGYPDQPPLVPLLARLVSTIAPGSLPVLRTPSALAAGAVVVLTALVARELGGGRAAQVLASATIAVAGLLLAVGHLLSTATFGLLAWVVVLWLVLRVLRTGSRRLWIVTGVVAGVGLLATDLVVFLLVALLIGILVAGPRRILVTPWPWAGALVAGALWTPYLIWQARHGWPQLDVGRQLASGSSGTSEPRVLFLPLQAVLVGPLLVPIWVAGLVRLLRDPGLRWCRSVGVAYPVLAVMFLTVGGKPYYLGGMFPVLLAAGAQPAIDWARRQGRRASPRRRRGVLAAAVASGVLAVPVTLPVLPVAVLHSTPVVAMNYDAGETLGWPRYVRQIASAYRRLSPDERAAAAVLTGNYGEAGAVGRYGRGLGLPRAFSGHNGYGSWGPPPASVRTVLAVGFGRAFLRRSFGEVERVGRLDNGVDVDADEQGVSIWVCRRPLADWTTLWPRFRSLG